MSNVLSPHESSLEKMNSFSLSLSLSPDISVLVSTLHLSPLYNSMPVKDKKH